MEVTGTILQGSGGKGHEGFPTANIICGLQKGVYVGTSIYGSCLVFVYSGYAHIHFIAFSGDVVGDEITLRNLKKVPEFFKGI